MIKKYVSLICLNQNNKYFCQKYDYKNDEQRKR